MVGKEPVKRGEKHPINQVKLKQISQELKIIQRTTKIKKKNNYTATTKPENPAFSNLNSFSPKFYYLFILFQYWILHYELKIQFSGQKNLTEYT